MSRRVRQKFLKAFQIPKTKIPRRLEILGMAKNYIRLSQSAGLEIASKSITTLQTRTSNDSKSHTTAQYYWYPITQYKCSMLFSASRNWFVQLHSTEIADGNLVIETAAFEDSRVFRVTPTKNLCEISIPRRQKQYFRVWTTICPRNQR